MTEASRHRPRIVVLTGAGASKPLGIPTMDGLLPNDFGKSLPGSEPDVFDMAANWAALQRPTALDFELLYTAVSMLASVNVNDPIAIALAPPRGNSGRFQFKQRTGSYIEANMEGYRTDAKAIVERLKNVVHERLSKIDTKEAARLYQGLFAFLSGIIGLAETLDVFTTNYDRAIEASFETPADALPSGFDFELVRGFARTARARAATWDAGEYERPSGTHFIVKLYKLHGSLDWRLENGVVQEVAADEYVGRNVVIYPIRKAVLAEPFRTLFDLFRRRLSDAQVCVVIGSSLRDDHIRAAIVDRARTGDFRVVLVDPNGDQVASLLNTELTPERASGQVTVANVAFGGGPQAQIEMEERIRAAVQDALSFGADRSTGTQG